MLAFVGLVLGFAGERFSYENPGIRLELLLKDIAARANVSFRCSPALKDEVIATSFRDQSVDVVKARLAEVVHATWELRGSEWWLVQSGDQNKEEITWHRDLRTRQYQGLIDEAKKKAPEKEWTQEDANKYLERTSSRPISGEQKYLSAGLGPQGYRSRFLARYFSQIELADLPLNMGEFCSVRLNAQPEILKIFDILQRERELVLSAQGKVWSRGKAVMSEMTIFDSANPSIMLRTCDQKGLIIDLGVSNSLAPATEITAEVFTPSPELKRKLDLVKYANSVEYKANEEDESERLQKHYEPDFAAARKYFREAKTRDPLGYIPGACWIEFAHTLGKPIMANLDEVEMDLWPSMFVPSLEKPAAGAVGMKRLDSEGWVLGRPIDPLFTRARRFDRDLLERQQILLDKEEEPTIQEQLEADYIFDYGRVLTQGVPLAPILGTEMDYMMDRSRILTGAYYSAVKAGVTPNVHGALPVSSFSAQARSILNTYLILGSMNTLATDDPDQSYLASMLFPNGLAGMSMTVRSDSVMAFCLEKEEQSSTDNYTLNQFAELIRATIDGAPKEIGTFKLGTMKRLELKLWSGNRSIEEEVFDVPVDKSKQYTWDTMPVAIREKVIEEMKKIDDGSGVSRNHKVFSL